MISKVKQALKNLTNPRPAFDPATLNDPMALRTAWTPAKRGGTNFRTHKAVEINPNRREFRSTIGAKLFSGLFLLVGLGVTVGFWATRFQSDSTPPGFNAETILPTVFGLIFAAVGGTFLFFSQRPIVFDKEKGYFWKGRKAPDQVFNTEEIKHCTALNQLHALQLVSEYIRGNKSSYYSYELNLVLTDGNRLNVIDHGNLKGIREDARELAVFLGKPLWDAT